MRRVISGVAVALVLLLGGCAATDYPATTAQSLQEAVLAVSVASSNGDWSAAQIALDDASARRDTANAEGTMGDERATEIAAAIAEVRFDLATLILAQQPAPEEGNGNGNGPPDKKDDEKDKPGKKP